MSAVNYSEGSKQSDPIERIRVKRNIEDSFLKSCLTDFPKMRIVLTLILNSSLEFRCRQVIFSLPT